MKYVVLTILFCITVSAQNWEQLQKIVASDREPGDSYGITVAFDSLYAVVGARYEDENENGTDSLDDAGSVYIYYNNNGSWEFVQKIVASDRSSRDYFGNSVAISGDYVIVGAYNEDEDVSGNNTLYSAGSAYIFQNLAGTWTQVQKIVSSDRTAGDYFGCKVGISGDWIVVGAYFEDHDAYGNSSKSGAGSAYIFKNEGGTWTQTEKIVANDRGEDDMFGNSISIDGEYIVIGSMLEDESAGRGDYILNSGSAYIFKLGSQVSLWFQMQKITASDRGFKDYFGSSVSISGDYVIVGARQENEDSDGNNTLNHSGSAYIFKNEAGTWNEIQKIVASDRNENDYFGSSVSISGDYAVVGANQEDEDVDGNNILDNSGSAYVFKNEADTWNEIQKIVASDRSVSDYFSSSVAINENYLFVGTINEDEDGEGNNTMENAGSVYIFENTNKLPVELTSFEAKTYGKNVELNWQTATEVNNYGFEIQRQAKDIAQSTVPTGRQAEWEKAGFVKGAGNSNSPKSYSFSDLISKNSNLVYRLKQVDLDGSFKYSNEIEIDVEGFPTEFALKQNYPNPFNPTTTIKYSIPAVGVNNYSPVRLIVYNLLGQEVATLVNQQQATGNYEVKFDGSNLASGIYLYKLNAGDFSSVKKLILVK